MHVSYLNEANFKKHKKSILRPKTRRPHFVKHLEPNVFLRHMAQNLPYDVTFIAQQPPKFIFRNFRKKNFGVPRAIKNTSDVRF